MFLNRFVARSNPPDRKNEVFVTPQLRLTPGRAAVPKMSRSAETSNTVKRGKPDNLKEYGMGNPETTPFICSLFAPSQEFDRPRLFAPMIPATLVPCPIKSPGLVIA